MPPLAMGAKIRYLSEIVVPTTRLPAISHRFTGFSRIAFPLVSRARHHAAILLNFPHGGESLLQGALVDPDVRGVHQKSEPLVAP